MWQEVMWDDLAVQVSGCMAERRDLGMRGHARMLCTILTRGPAWQRSSHALLHAMIAARGIADSNCRQLRARSLQEMKQLRKATWARTASLVDPVCRLSALCLAARPTPVQIGVGQVIKGWDMGILGAEVGAGTLF